MEVWMEVVNGGVNVGVTGGARRVFFVSSSLQRLSRARARTCVRVHGACCGLVCEVGVWSWCVGLVCGVGVWGWCVRSGPVWGFGSLGTRGAHAAIMGEGVPSLAIPKAEGLISG